MIKELTKDCERDDCRLWSSGGVSTCMGWTPTYDKHGNQTDDDPNTHSSQWKCSSCRREWLVSTRRGERTITVLANQSTGGKT